MKAINNLEGLSEARKCAVLDDMAVAAAKWFARMAPGPYGAVSVEDMMQDGRMGILKAIRKFDASRGASLRSFVYLCIRHAIIKGRRHMRRAPRDFAHPRHEQYAPWRHDKEVEERF